MKKRPISLFSVVADANKHYAVDRDLHGSMAKQELNLIPVRHLRNTAWHKYATGRAGRGSRFLLA